MRLGDASSDQTTSEDGFPLDTSGSGDTSVTAPGASDTQSFIDALTPDQRDAYFAQLAANANGGAITQQIASGFGLDWQRMVNQAATAGGAYIARTVGGQTVLYPNNQGGLSSLNLQKLLPVAAIGLIVMLLAKGHAS